MTTVNIKYLSNYNLKEWGELGYKFSGDSGFDLRAANETDIYIRPGKMAKIPTGISVRIDEGFELQVRTRSGLAFNHQIFVLNSPGTVDAGYRNEIGVLLYNLGETDFLVLPGMRIAQAVITRVERAVLETVSSLENSDRGLGGFGSTGIR